MNTRKSWFLSLTMLALISLTSFANNSVIKDPNSVNDQFHKLLKNVAADFEDDSTVYIDFMLNDKAEIIVLSTSDKDLDMTLKSVLNYKTLKSGDLEFYKKYTVPVRFNRK